MCCKDFLCKLIPNVKSLGSVNFSKPEIGRKNLGGTILTILAVLMVVAVFLPWFSWEYVDDASGKHVLESAFRLGITTLWGILGLVVALVALFGALYKQYALTLWAAILAVVFGYIGANSVYTLEFTMDKTDYIILKEELQLLDIFNRPFDATHLGANIFTIVAALLAALSFTQIIKREEETKPGCIAKAAFTISVIITTIICIDAVLVTPTCLSVLVVKILAWHLPLIVVMLIAYSLVNGEGKSLNITSIAILAVAFFFTNPATVLTKYVQKEQHNIQNVVAHDNNSKKWSVIMDKESTKDLIEDFKKEAKKTSKKRMDVGLDRLGKHYNEYSESRSLPQNVLPVE